MSETHGSGAMLGCEWKLKIGREDCGVDAVIEEPVRIENVGRGDSDVGGLIGEGVRIDRSDMMLYDGSFMINVFGSGVEESERGDMFKFMFVDGTLVGSFSCCRSISSSYFCTTPKISALALCNLIRSNVLSTGAIPPKNVSTG